jgi:quercetin dioxygenase-like cupin family protein
MPAVHHAKVAPEPMEGGATYQTLVGDEVGSTPIRLGVQTSPPGFRTPIHSHPYMETLTVLAGKGEAWMEGGADIENLHPGVTVVVPANVRHWFGASRGEPLITLGVHASPHRIVTVHDR